MTDSLKLSAFRDSRIDESVPGIGALQVEVGARARVATRRTVEAALPPAADVARPPGFGEEVEHVGPAQQADHLAAPDHRYAPAPFADQEPRRLVDAGFLADRDDPPTHHAPLHLPFPPAP